MEERINAGWPDYRAAPAAGVSCEAPVYPGVTSGFHKDITPRYDAAAAEVVRGRKVALIKTDL